MRKPNDSFDTILETRCAANFWRGTHLVRNFLAVRGCLRIRSICGKLHNQQRTNEDHYTVCRIRRRRKHEQRRASQRTLSAAAFELAASAISCAPGTAHVKSAETSTARKGCPEEPNAGAIARRNSFWRNKLPDGVHTRKCTQTDEHLTCAVALHARASARTFSAAAFSAASASRSAAAA